MKKQILNVHRAVTLTELLVVLAILSLLATIAVPVYVQKTEQARRATARFEVRTIAEAQQQVALAHSYFVPIHLLDNLANNPDETDERDDWDNYQSAGAASTFLTNPFVSLEDQTSDQVSVAEAINGNDVTAAQMLAYWSGPFLNPARVAYDPGAPNNAQNIAYDLVLDPWGRPYVFYSPVGPLFSFTGTDLRGYDVLTNGTSRIQADDGRLRNLDGSNLDPFDRYAIVSYGSNGQLDANGAGNTALADDDVFYTFAAPFNETAFNAF